MESNGFKAFFTDNKDWLVPYAAFSYLRDEYKTAEFGKWPKYSKYNKKEVEKEVGKEEEKEEEAVGEIIKKKNPLKTL